VWCGNHACLIPSPPATTSSNRTIIYIGNDGGGGAFVGDGGGSGAFIGGDGVVAFSKSAAGDNGDGSDDIGVDWNLREAESMWIARG
jgi:hypothetical protein